MVDFLWQALAIVFYVLFFAWIFLKLRNIFLVYKLNCKESYKVIKKNVKNSKMPKLFKYGKIFIIALLILIALYIVGLIISLMFSLIILIITGFGVALETEELLWLKYILALFYLYLSSFKYGIYAITIAVYIIFYTILPMRIYIECIRYKELKNIKENT